MNTALQEIVNAVLYEGYILYPYRASSQKNQRERFTFGRIYPEMWKENQNTSDLCQIQAEVLLETRNEIPELQITVGFLQPIQREIGELPEPVRELPVKDDPRIGVVPKLELNGKLYQTWVEATERQVTVPLKALQGSIEARFNFEAQHVLDPIHDEQGLIAAVIRRTQSAISGKIIVQSQPLKPGLSKLSVTVVNQSLVEAVHADIKNEVLMSTMASSHVIFRAAHGEFVSLLETPEELKFFSNQCQNVGVWPVLVGDKTRDDRSVMLASPIILYDYPEISANSAGDFCDGTEIDEMLTLRVMTLTDAEKQEMRADDFARRILERTQSLSNQDILKLHGGRREVHFSGEEFFNPTHSVKTVRVDGVELVVGDKVCICPARRADAIDMILAGKKAVIEALEQDAEGEIHLALVLEEDPGNDLGMARQSGHRFFYRANEVTPVKAEVTA